MKFAVMGAGSVGSYYGALLALAGLDVTLIGRTSHVAAISERGLFLDSATFSGLVPIAATTDPGSIDTPDVVLFCVKSTDTVTAGEALAPFLTAKTTVFSLQNGVDNAERLQRVLACPVVPVAVYVAAELIAPGHVKHHGRGDLVLGPSPVSRSLAGTLTEAGIPTTVSDDVRSVLWGKLMVNCAYNALSAISQLPYGRLLNLPVVRDVMRDVVDECRAVAKASGVAIAEDPLPAVLAIADAMPGQLSSTAQDLARGKTSEIDHLNGFIVRLGAELNIPTPANRTLYVLVKLAESAKGR